MVDLFLSQNCCFQSVCGGKLICCWNTVLMELLLLHKYQQEKPISIFQLLTTTYYFCLDGFSLTLQQKGNWDWIADYLQNLSNYCFRYFMWKSSHSYQYSDIDNACTLLYTQNWKSSDTWVPMNNFVKAHKYSRMYKKKKQYERKFLLFYQSHNKCGLTVIISHLYIKNDSNQPHSPTQKKCLKRFGDFHCVP